MGILDQLIEKRVGVEKMESEKGEVRKVMEAGGAAVAFDIDSDFDLSAFESTQGGTSESREVELKGNGGTPASGGKLAWGQIQIEILDAVLDDEDEWGGENLTALASRLRSSIDDFAEILNQTDEQQWNAKRLERLLQRERIRNRDLSWSEVEAGAIGKLINIVNGKTVKTSEILAIAQVANRAIRRKDPNNMGENRGNTTINVNGAQGAEIQLPGSGNLGTMKLTLSARTVNQLSQGITIEATAEKYTDGIEMLGGDDVPQLSKLADES